MLVLLQSAMTVSCSLKLYYYRLSAGLTDNVHIQSLAYTIS
jgi:hypothetical protein